MRLNLLLALCLPVLLLIWTLSGSDTWVMALFMWCGVCAARLIYLCETGVIDYGDIASDINMR